MPEDHRHCVVCGKVVGADKFFCSPQCEGTFKQHQKRMSRMRLYPMLILVVFILLFLILVTFGGK